MPMGFILRIQIRRYYDDWQLEESEQDCLKKILWVSVLEGTGWLSEMCCIPSADLGGAGGVSAFLSQCLSFSSCFVWYICLCHKWHGSEPHTQLRVYLNFRGYPHVYKLQYTKIWVIEITNIIQYNDDKHVFLYFLFHLTMRWSLGRREGLRAVLFSFCSAVYLAPLQD